MQIDLPKAPTISAGSSQVRLESEPTGADARTSTGQNCRTPCALSVPANDFTVTFSLPGYQPQSVPVRVVSSNGPGDMGREEMGPMPPTLMPNPVFVELMPAPPPPPARKPAAKPKPKPKPKPVATRQAPAPTAAQAPAPAPAAAWPAPPPR